ncbi:MAG TPA: SRPBCC family protein [Chloroflexota bacterium]|nr:SRPBCC family protein [Chloroflexota bacterium]
MDPTSSGTTTLTLPSDREILITRVFAAPRRLVFEALTRPEHVRRWYGPRRLTLTVCEIDLRPGGAWRYVLCDPESGQEFGFSGVYREIVPPERIVSTEGYEALPGHDYLVTVTLDEHDGQTTLRSHLLYQSREDRDGHLRAGMEPGMRESFARLAELLADPLVTG